MRITIYRGSHEIGGTCIELQNNDKTGKEMIGFQYNDCGDFHEGLAKVCKKI